MVKEHKSIHTALICLIVFLAAWVRLNGIENKSLWYDEVHSLECANGRGYDKLRTGVVMGSPPHLTSLKSARPWWRIWTPLRHTTHPPLYFVMLRLWRHLFGEGIGTARGLSTVWSLVAIILLFLVSRILHGPTVALSASLFMALAVPQVVYAQEARSYTMTLALALASCVTLLRLKTYGATILRVLGLTLSLLSLLLTYYFSVTLVAVLGLYALMTCRYRTCWWALCAFAIALLLFCVLWGPFLIAQWPNFHSHFVVWIVDRAPGHFRRSLGLLAAFPVRAFVEIPGFVAPFSSPSHMSILVGVIAWGVMLALLLRRHDEVWFWTLWSVLPLSVLLMADLAQSTRFLAVTRYGFIAMPGIYVLVALAMAYLRPVTQRLLLAGILLAGVSWSSKAAAQVGKPHWPDVAAYLDRVASPSDVLLYESQAMIPRNYYRRLFSGVSYYMRNKLPVLFLDGDLEPEALERLKKAVNIWVVTPWLSRQARRSLSGFQLQERRSFGTSFDEVCRMVWRGDA